MNNFINMTGWHQYWDLFDKLCDSLLTRSKNKLVAQLDEARLYVKDSYEAANAFLKTLNSILLKNQDTLTLAEKKMANTLTASLQAALENM
jgi:hypothetical protein